MTIKQLIGLFKRDTYSYWMTPDSEYEGLIHVYMVEILTSGGGYYVVYSLEAHCGFHKTFNRFSDGTLGTFDTLEEAVEQVNLKLGRGFLSVLKNYPYLMWKMIPHYKRRFFSKINEFKDRISYRARRIIG